MASTAPEVTVTDELPGNAFIIIEKPGQPAEVYAGSDAASAEALTHCNTGTEIIQAGDVVPRA